MTTNFADPIEEDSRTATFERKRPLELVSHDNPSTAGSVPSTPRKRAKHTGKQGHQDVKDFVSAGGSFSASAAPLVAEQHNDIPNSPVHRSSFSQLQEQEGERESVFAKGHGYNVISKDRGGEPSWDAINSVTEGLRLFVGNLHFATKEEDVRKFFKGYTMSAFQVSFPQNNN